MVVEGYLELLTEQRQHSVHNVVAFLNVGEPRKDEFVYTWSPVTE